MSKRDNRNLLLVGALVLVLWMRSRDGDEADGYGGTGRNFPTKKKLPTAKKNPRAGKNDGVIDVDKPKLRPPTDAERKAAKRPPGTVSASPELEARHGQTPAGYDASKARSQAQGIAAHLAAKGPKAYDRNRLAVWQTFAGIRADGTYGGSTRGALVFYGVQNPPRPFVAPYATLPYHPPT